MYRLDGVYRSELLSALPWLEHGFGSKKSAHWPGEYTRVKQIHSNTVVIAGQCVETGDALISNEPGRLIGIRTADCVPLLMVDRARRAVVAVHAGWRGSASNITAAAVRRLTSEFGSDPKDLAIAIGPSIGRCCFEVGPEVSALFGDSSEHVDLVDVNRLQLISTGVEENNIDVCGLCTYCTSGEFHSWRRDREAAGRMVAGIGIRLR